MTLNEAIELNDKNLPLVKFRYDAKTAHTKKPRVIVIDSNYPGRLGEKRYDTRKDLLGIKLNDYPGDKKKLRTSLSQVALFADFLEADKKERYERMRDFVPECLPYIRRYKKKHISNLRAKDGMFYKKAFLTSKDNYFKEKE